MATWLTLLCTLYEYGHVDYPCAGDVYARCVGTDEQIGVFRKFQFVSCETTAALGALSPSSSGDA